MVRSALLLAIALELLAVPARAQGRPPSPASAAAPRSLVPTPPALPRRGYFSHVGRLFTRAEPTPVDVLVKSVKRAPDRQTARSMLTRFFKEPRTGQANLSTTAFTDLFRLMNLADSTTGSQKTSKALLLQYAKYWMPSVTPSDLNQLMMMSGRSERGRGAHQDALVVLYTSERFFKAKAPTQIRQTLAGHEDRFFDLVDYARPTTRRHILRQYGEAFGKDAAWGEAQFSTWRGARVASSAARERAAREGGGSIVGDVVGGALLYNAAQNLHLGQ
jgi:hypothetical protein